MELLLTTIQIKNLYKFLLITTEWLCIFKWCHEVFDSKCAIHEIKKRYVNIYNSNFSSFEKIIFIQKMFKSIELNFKDDKDENNVLFTILNEEENIKQ